MSMEIWIDNDLITSTYRGIRANLRENTDVGCRFICTDFSLYIYMEKSWSGHVFRWIAGLKLPADRHKKAAFYDKKRP